jgi:hypothetical protein
MLLFGLFFGVYMAASYKTVALDKIDDRILTLAGSVGSVCNGSSRIIWATAQDRFGFKKVYLYLMVT